MGAVETAGIESSASVVGPMAQNIERMPWLWIGVKKKKFVSERSN